MRRPDAAIYQPARRSTGKSQASVNVDADTTSSIEKLGSPNKSAVQAPKSRQKRPEQPKYVPKRLSHTTDSLSNKDTQDTSNSQPVEGAVVTDLARSNTVIDDSSTAKNNEKPATGASSMTAESVNSPLTQKPSSGNCMVIMARVS